MNTVSAKIILCLGPILAMCVAPVYAFRKDRREALLTASAIIGFFILNRYFISGMTGTYHDVRGSEYFFYDIIYSFRNGLSIGWDPYMGAGQPFYLYSFSTLTPFGGLFACLGRYLSMDYHCLFNLAFMATYLFACTGWFLFFFSLFEDFKVSFFCFLSLLYSGLFFISMGQPAGLHTTLYLPYILFLIMELIKRRRHEELLFIFLFISAAINLYVPSYLFFILGVFIISLFIFSRRTDPGLRHPQPLLSNKPPLGAALIMSILLAAPAVFFVTELPAYISPIRKTSNIFTHAGGTIASMPLSVYRVYLDGKMDVHFAFYFGVVLLLFLPFAIPAFRDKTFRAIVFSCAVIAALSHGAACWGYRQLISVPFFGTMRHSWVLTTAATLFLICVCGYGFREYMRLPISGGRTLTAAAVLSFAGLAIFAYFMTRRADILVYSFILLAVFYLCQRGSARGPGSAFSGRVIRYLYVIPFLLMVAELSSYYTSVTVNRDSVFCDMPSAYQRIDYPIAHRYPTTRHLLSERWFLPPDYSPFVHRRASLMALLPYKEFFRNKRLDDTIQYLWDKRMPSSLVGVDSDLIYFTNMAAIEPAGTSKEGLIRSAFDFGSNIPLRGAVFSAGDIDFRGPALKEAAYTDDAPIEYKKTDDPNHLSITVDAPSDGFLVRLENYHYGWRAWVDGKATKVYRANYAFQAIRVPKGFHAVTFKFITLYPVLFYMHLAAFVVMYLAFIVFLYRIPVNGQEHL